MSFAQYTRILRRQWHLVVLLCGITLAAGAAYTYTKTPMYTSTAQLFVNVNSPRASAASLSQGNSFTAARVKSYTNIMDNSLLLGQVIKDLKLPYSVSRLSQSVSASNPLDSVLLNLTVEDSNPDRAADIARAITLLFPPLVDRLETPDGRTTSPVKITVVRPPTVPKSPVSPDVRLNLALSLMIGLFLGVAGAVAREQLNTVLREPGDVEEVSGSQPLVVVPFDAATPKNVLVDTVDGAERAEAFRSLRTNLQFSDVDSPLQVILVTSPSPKDGKTSTACNLALTMAILGKHVALVDADLRRPAIGQVLGISDAAGLTSVLLGKHHLKDVVLRYRHDNLMVLPSGPLPPNPSELLGSQHMRDMMSVLRNHFDVVVIDAPPLLPVSDAAVLSTLVDGTIVVTRYGKTRREELRRALAALTVVGTRIVGVVLNRAPRNLTQRGGYSYGAPNPARVSLRE